MGSFIPIKQIIKRDGTYVPFDKEKIVQAIFKAAQAVGGDDIGVARKVADDAVQLLIERKFIIPTVDQVQDAVEKSLIEAGHSTTSKAYILYRYKKDINRNLTLNLIDKFQEITFSSEMESDMKRENANIDSNTAMGTMLKFGSESAKEFYRMRLMDKKFSEAHKAGDIHVHDMDFYAFTTTCCQIDLLKLFKNGFSTGHGFLREPNSIASYAALACIAIQSNQNEQHGGQSVPFFDYAMAEGVKKTYAKAVTANLAKGMDIYNDIFDADTLAKEVTTALAEDNIIPSMLTIDEYLEKVKAFMQSAYRLPMDFPYEQIFKFTKKYAEKETNKQTYQAMEALIHNLNTMHSRAGAQIPFSSLNYGTDTSPEGRMAIKNLLLATEAGLGKGETPIFPIQIFKVKEGINYNPEDPNYDLLELACRVSAKRLFPNFSFLDAPFNLQYYKENNYNTEVAYMGCRTRVMGNVYDSSKEVTAGRGNLSFTSINLPRLGILANGNIKRFYALLDEKMELVFSQLLERLRLQSMKQAKNFPFLMGQGIWLDSDTLNPDNTVAEVLRHGTLTVGFIGLAETLVALIGKHHGESAEAQKLGLEIISYMRAKADAKAQETKLNFSLIATPAEGLSGRFTKLDKKKFGIIKGVTDKDYYTNSFHIPVYHPISAYEKIQLEAPYHALTNAGHISYVELDGDVSKNIPAFISIVKAMKEAGIGYGAINHPVDRHIVCGYTGIIDDVCPSCGFNAPDEEVERIRRITGYLVGTMDRWNNGKRAEERDRVKHACNHK